MENDRAFSIQIKNPYQITVRSHDNSCPNDNGEADFSGTHFNFNNYKDWLSAFSGRRIKLIKILHVNGPLSIRALSKALSRDYKSVHGDVSRLMEIGLIEKREDGLIEAPYDKIISEIRLKAA